MAVDEDVGNLTLTFEFNSLGSAPTDGLVVDLEFMNGTAGIYAKAVHGSYIPYTSRIIGHISQHQRKVTDSSYKCLYMHAVKSLCCVKSVQLSVQDELAHMLIKNNFANFFNPSPPPCTVRDAMPIPSVHVHQREICEACNKHRRGI